MVLLSDCLELGPFSFAFCVKDRGEEPVEVGLTRRVTA